MKRENKVYLFLMSICLGILFVITLSIFLRTFTRQLLVKRLHIDNALTKTVLFDLPMIQEQHNEKEADAENETVSESNTKVINWEQLYPFKTDDVRDIEDDSSIEKTDISEHSYYSVIKDIEAKTEIYSQDFLMFYYNIVLAANSFDKLIGIGAMNKSHGDVLIMQNGYLTYKQELVDTGAIEEIADSVLELSDFCDAQGVDFVYANAGSKVCPYDRQLYMGAVEYTNENGDNLIHALRARGINTIDFREYMIEDKLDWYGSYYIGDHHWKNTTALWAAGRLAEYLDDNFGYEFDDAYFDENNYDITAYEDFFTGGQERTAMTGKREPYSTVLPKFDTDLSLSIPTREIDISGDYREVLFDDELFDEIKKYTDVEHMTVPDAYNLARNQNDALCRIVNNDPKDNKDKKILFIYDSFSWYLADYIALDTGSVDMMYNSLFDGSVRTYIEKEQPDTVILILCERNIKPIKWNHKASFDLR